MNKLPRLLQPLVIVILLVSVVALAFVAYSQHQEQQNWHNKYVETLSQPFKQEGLPVTLQLSRYANATDIDKTVFTDHSHHKIEPLTITLYSDWDIVTFWFDRQSLDNWQLLLHLPNWSQDTYVTINVPFFDYQPTLGN